MQTNQEMKATVGGIIVQLAKDSFAAHGWSAMFPVKLIDISQSIVASAQAQARHEDSEDLFAEVDFELFMETMR